MASPIANTFESGTNNTTITAGNSASPTAITSQVVSGATTGQFSTAFAHGGTLSYRLAYATSQAGYAIWNYVPATTTTRTAWRFYVYIGSAETVTSTDLFAIRSASANVASIAINSSNRLIVRNSAGTTLGTAGADFPRDQWVRIELGVAVGGTTSTGSVQAEYYLGDSTTPVASLINTSTTNTGTAAIALVRLGATGTVASARTVYYDDFAGQELASGLIGPTTTAVSGTAASAVTATGAASGHVDRHGSAAAGITVARAAAGTVAKHGVAGLNVTAAGATSGTRGKRGTAAQAVTATRTAAGTLTKHGAAAATITDTGAGTGHRGQSTVTPSGLTITLVASGTVGHGESADGVLELAVVGVASGTVHRHGSAALVVEMAGVAAPHGNAFNRVTATATTRWAAAADSPAYTAAASRRLDADADIRTFTATASNRWEATSDRG